MVAEKNAEPASAKATKKVTIRKAVAERIRLLNSSGELKQELRLSAVALQLSKLEEEAALDVLDALLEISDDVEDTNSFVCKRARDVAQEHEKKVAEEEAAAEEAAVAKWQEEHGGDWDEQWEEETPKPKKKKVFDGRREGESDESVVKRRVKMLNKSEQLLDHLEFENVVKLIPLLGADEFLRILNLLEAKAEKIKFPTPFVRREALKRAGPVMVQADALNRSRPGKMDLLAPIDIATVKATLSTVSQALGLQVLEELEKKALEIEEPTSWIKEEVERRLSSSPAAKQLQRLNDGGKLHAPIRIGSVLTQFEALLASDTPVANRILWDVERRGKALRDPTGFLNVAIAKINVGKARTAAALQQRAKAKAAASKQTQQAEPQDAEEADSIAGSTTESKNGVKAKRKTTQDEEDDEDWNQEEVAEQTAEADEIDDLDGIC